MDSHIEDGPRKIIFNGTNTKYQMKKVSGLQPSEPKVRVGWTEDNPLDQPSQLDLLSKCPPKDISTKLNGYRNQDSIKNRLDAQTFITVQQTIDLLVQSNLTCLYCKCFTPILYKNVRDGSQWSLDRIDNDKGHAFDNVVISCLKCNLQRKRMSSNTFAMSKQMVLTRI